MNTQISRLAGVLSVVTLMLSGMVGCQSLPRSGYADPRGQLLPSFTVYSEKTPQVTLPQGFQNGGVLVIIYDESGRQDALDWQSAMVTKPLTKPAVIVETNPEYDIDFRWSRMVLPGSAKLEEVYPLIELTGTDRPDLARVIYFNDSGRITWMWDGGYHEIKLTELRAAMRP